MGKLSRTKGATEERMVAALFKKNGWPDACRNLDQYQATDGKDLKNTWPFVVQCKVGKAPSPWKAYKEAADEAKESEIAIATVRRDGERALAIIDLADLMRVVGMSQTTFYKRGEQGGKITNTRVTPMRSAVE